ncbi:CoA pyrophosphatase [Balneolales bacterium ANBcel1]|nr:CoA pyrophosphatase [Balneolales bacterium ANBcel1]
MSFETHSTFSDYCKAVMERRLPGRDAQAAMAPVPDNRPDTSQLPESGVRQSSVLVLCSLEQPVSILYTLRNKTLTNHAGQISFPGGRQQPGEALRETAMRETAEEVGISPNQYEITGSLSPLFVPPSRFVIHPWLAFCRRRPRTIPRPEEVSDIFWVTAADLLDSGNIRTRDETFRNNRLRIPYWDVHSEPLWGATAMITSELVALYHRFLTQHERGNTDGLAGRCESRPSKNDTP